MHQPGSSQDDKRQQRLQAIARPAARDPGPLVILVGKRTVAKVHSIGLVVKVDPTLGRVAVELEQHVSAIDDLGDRFRAVRAESISNALIATCACRCPSDRLAERALVVR